MEGGFEFLGKGKSIVRVVTGNDDNRTVVFVIFKRNSFKGKLKQSTELQRMFYQAFWSNGRISEISIVEEINCQLDIELLLLIGSLNREVFHAEIIF